MMEDPFLLGGDMRGAPQAPDCIAKIIGKAPGSAVMLRDCHLVNIAAGPISHQVFPKSVHMAAAPVSRIDSATTGAKAAFMPHLRSYVVDPGLVCSGKIEHPEGMSLV